MIEKEKFTLNVLTILDKYCNLKSGLFDLVKDTDSLVTFKSKKFNFYFKIVTWDEQTKGEKFIIEVFPTDRNNLSVNTYNTDPGTLDGYFKIWIDLLEGYEKITHFPFEIDPIEKAYQEDYFSEVRIVDADADIKPFNYEQQDFLNDQLDACIQKIKSFGDDEINSNPELTDILHTAIEVKLLLPKLPKNEWLKHLSKLWGKASKFSFEFAKSLIIDIGVSYIKAKYQLGQ